MNLTDRQMAKMKKYLEVIWLLSKVISRSYVRGVIFMKQQLISYFVEKTEHINFTAAKM